MTHPVPLTLRTARLHLRSWAPDDAPALLPVLQADYEYLAPWIPAHVATPVPLPELTERLAGFAADFAAGKSWRYALLAEEGTRVVGECALFPRANGRRVTWPEADHAEVGYWLASAVTGQGLATEAARALVEVAAALPRMTHVEIHCDPANAPSSAVARRLGFELASEHGDTQVWRKPLALRADATA